MGNHISSYAASARCHTIKRPVPCNFSHAIKAQNCDRCPGFKGRPWSPDRIYAKQLTGGGGGGPYFRLMTRTGLKIILACIASTMPLALRAEAPASERMPVWPDTFASRVA